MGHSQEAPDLVRYRLVAVGDRTCAVILIQFGTVEAANYAVLVGTHCKIDLHSHRCPSRRTDPSQRLPAAPSRHIPVQRPREGLEEGRLARAVGTDDRRESGPQQEFRFGVLPEVDELEAVESHYPSVISRSTCSR